MKRFLAVLVAATAIGVAASAGTAEALTFRAVCSHGQSGITLDGHFKTKAPFYIHISTRADNYIAAHAPLFEGQLLFPAPVRQVPCPVAVNVAIGAMRAWENWPRDTGKVTITLSGPPVHLGRFYCTGQTYESSRRTYETCSHTGVHVGTIVVKFVINATP